MRKLACFLILIPFFLSAQNSSCDNAIELGDSSCTYDCLNSEELWFKFRAGQKKFVMNIVTADSARPLDYILYVNEPEFCDHAKNNLVIPLGVSFHFGPHEYKGLTLEQLRGACCCNTCETRERFLSLKPDSLYYLRVFTRGKNVFIKKDFDYECKAPEKDPFAINVEVGKTIKLENLNFVPESPMLLKESFVSLEKLHSFMNENPTVRIEIQGHVNSPGNKKDPKDQILSEARANSVKSYLVNKGVAKDRITSKGYGNTRMLYPVPRNEQEQRANRRVEILITAK